MSITHWTEAGFLMGSNQWEIHFWMGYDRADVIKKRHRKRRRSGFKGAGAGPKTWTPAGNGGNFRCS